MSLLTLIAVAWLLGPLILFCAVVAFCEWVDRRRAEIRFARLLDDEDLMVGLLLAMDDDPTPHGRRH